MDGGPDAILFHLFLPVRTIPSRYLGYGPAEVREVVKGVPPTFSGSGIVLFAPGEREVQQA